MFGGYLSTTCTRSAFIHSNSMCVSLVTSDEIIKIINSLKNKFSTGYDDVPISLLKECKYEMSSLLATAINISIYAGKFPGVLKR